MSDSLTDQAQAPHRETNEDGHVQGHSGYTWAHCRKCGASILKARTVFADECGRCGLDKDKHHADV